MIDNGTNPQQEAPQPPPPSPGELHDMLVTSLLSAVSTRNQRLVEFAKFEYAQFWQHHMIVPRPPEARGDCAPTGERSHRIGRIQKEKGPREASCRAKSEV